MNKQSLISEKSQRFNDILKSIKPSSSRDYCFKIFNVFGGQNYSYNTHTKELVKGVIYDQYISFGGTPLTESEEFELYSEVDKGRIEIHQISRKAFINSFVLLKAKII